MRFMEQLRQRKAERENPTGAALPGVLQLQGQFGEQEIPPELMEQFLGAQGTRKEAIPGVMQQLQGLRGRVLQKRLNDFRQHLGNAMQEHHNKKSQNAFMINMMKSRFGDEEFGKFMEESSRAQEQQDFQTMLKNLALGFEDLHQLPEFQQLLREAQMQGVMGPMSSPSQEQGRGFRAPAPSGMPGMER